MKWNGSYSYSYSLVLNRRTARSNWVPVLIQWYIRPSIRHQGSRTPDLQIQIAIQWKSIVRYFDRHREEDYDKIFSIAFPLYDIFNTSEEIIKMATLMVDNVLAHNPNNYYERAVIATLSYFVDNYFKIATNPLQLDVPKMQPEIPKNWRDVIGMNVMNGQEWRNVYFVVRKKTQTYELTLSSVCTAGFDSGTISVLLVHVGNHRGFSMDLHSSEVNGLCDIDLDLASAYGAHILKKLMEAMELPVKKAAKDQAPSTPMSPI